MRYLRSALVAATLVCVACGGVAIGEQPAGQLAGHGVSAVSGGQISSQAELGVATIQANSAQQFGSDLHGTIPKTGTTHLQEAPAVPVGTKAPKLGTSTAGPCGSTGGKVSPMCPVVAP